MLGFRPDATPPRGFAAWPGPEILFRWAHGGARGGLGVDSVSSRRDKAGMNDTRPPVRPATALTVEPCPSCGAPRPGPFCAACGEKRLDPAHDHSLRWLAGQILEGVLQWDTKLLRTFGTLLRRPGQLTRDHLDGRRVRTMAPLSLFFLTSVVFYCFFERAYAAPVQVLANAYANGGWLGNLLHYDIGGVLAAKAVAAGTTAEMLAQRVFDRAGQESKVFLGLLVPLLAAVLHALFWRREPRYVPHFLAALHLFVVFLLFDLVFLFGWRLAGADAVSDLMFLPLLAGFGVHVWLALPRIYGVGRWPALGPTVVLLAALTALILVYRQAITVVVAVLT